LNTGQQAEVIAGRLYWFVGDIWEVEVLIPVLVKGVRNGFVYYIPFVGHASLWGNPLPEERFFRTQQQGRLHLAREQSEAGGARPVR